MKKHLLIMLCIVGMLFTTFPTVLKANEGDAVEAFSEDKVTLTFDLKGGITNAPTTFEMDKGSFFKEEVEDPTKDGNKFLGWCRVDVEPGQQCFYEDMFYPTNMEKIDDNTTVYAWWGEHIDESEFSQDIIDYLSESYYLDLPFVKEELESIAELNLFYNKWNDEIDDYETVVINDVKGMQYLKNVSMITLPLGPNYGVHEEALSYMQDFEFIDSIVFAYENGISGDFSEFTFETYKQLSDPQTMKHVEEVALQYLMRLNYSQNATDNTIRIRTEMPLAFTDNTFLEPLNTFDHIFSLEVWLLEYPKRFYIPFEEVQRNGETMYALSLENPQDSMYYDHDGKFIVDTNRDYQTVQSISVQNVNIYDYDEYTEEEIEKIELPVQIEYIRKDGSVVESNTDDFHVVSGSEAYDKITVFYNELQYKELVNNPDDWNESIYVSTEFINYDLLEEAGGPLSNLNYIFSNHHSYSVFPLLDPVPEVYEVNFDADGGLPEPETQYIREGEFLEEVEQPVKDGAVFEGWYYADGTRADSQGKKWDFASDPVTSNMTLTARYETEHLVQFDVDGGAPKPADQNVVENKLVAVVTEPTKAGFTFDGWYLGAKKWDFATDKVTSAMTLKAKWEPVVNSYLVQFDVDGGAPKPVDQNVVENKLVAIVTEPTKAGFKFDGWYHGAKKWDFASDKVTSAMTLKAKWVVDGSPTTRYIVTFDSNGGRTTPDSQTVDAGSLVQKVESPTKEGFAFVGWYLGDNAWDFDSDKVDSNITLTAKWLKDKQPVELDPVEDKEVTTENETPSTGVSMNIVMYLGLSVISLLLLVSKFIQRKKNI